MTPAMTSHSTPRGQGTRKTATGAERSSMKLSIAPRESQGSCRPFWSAPKQAWAKADVSAREERDPRALRGAFERGSRLS